MQTIEWPPPYRLRRSERARNIYIAIDPKTGLEIILPKRATIHEALSFLDTKRRWVEKHAHLLNISTAMVVPEVKLPDSIKFEALSLEYVFRYHPIPGSKRIKIYPDGQQIFVAGATENISSAIVCIKVWLKRQAEIYLSPWLQQISNAHGLCYHSLSFRGQNTLWGSCSRTKDISLNYKLLFLPQRLVQYVLVHELCHTKHLNHSKKFWGLVAKLEPNYASLRRELRDAQHYVPVWIHE